MFSCSFAAVGWILFKEKQLTKDYLCKNFDHLVIFQDKKLWAKSEMSCPPVLLSTHRPCHLEETHTLRERQRESEERVRGGCGWGWGQKGSKQTLLHLITNAVFAGRRWCQLSLFLLPATLPFPTINLRKSIKRMSLNTGWWFSSRGVSGHKPFFSHYEVVTKKLKYTQRQTTMHTHIQTYGKFRVSKFVHRWSRPFRSDI